MTRLQKYRLLPLAAVALTFPAAGLAEDTIIVDGTRLPAPLAEVGSSVSVITAEDIELKGYVFAADAIASASGVTLNQNGAFGGVTSIRIRGAGADQTLVLLDGVPISDPAAVGGGYDFSILDAADIERIEILKGAHSTLWGSDAIGGVVNIISKKPDVGFGGKLFAEGGSFKTYRGGAALQGGGDAGDFRLSATGLTSDGISKAEALDGNGESDEYQSLTFSGRGGLNLSGDLRLDAFARYMEGETEIDGFPPPIFTIADTEDFSKTEQFTGSVTLHAPLFDNRLTNMLTAGFTDIKRTGNFGGFETVDKGDRLILRYQGTVTIDARNRLAAGAEREESRANGAMSATNSVFGLYEVKPFEMLTLSAGVRYDDHSQFGSATTARAAAALSPAPWLVLRGSWGEGFKAPSIFQLTRSFGAAPANADLKPETSQSWDAGVDFSLMQERAALSVTYFHRDTENLIIFAPNFRYENLEATTASGVETAAELAIAEHLTLSAVYTFIDAIDAATGEPQIKVPRHSGNLSLAYRNANLKGAAVLRYNGAETEGAFGIGVDDWLRLDLSAAYAISETLEFYGRIENATDETYQQVSGYGTPGVSGYGGVRVSF